MTYCIDPKIYDEEFDENNIEHFLASGLLPYAVSETGNTDEPVLDATICTSISGGAAFKNDMPKMLTLTRRLADGTEYSATYEQV